MSVNEQQEGADGDETGVDRPVDKRLVSIANMCMGYCPRGMSFNDCNHSPGRSINALFFIKSTCHFKISHFYHHRRAKTTLFSSEVHFIQGIVPMRKY